MRLNPPALQKRFLNNNLALILLSIALQLILGYFFGHIYDMRIFMATGFLAGTGQNPYIPQDLSAIFHNISFQGITTIGYPPMWPLLLGLIYRISYAIFPNFLVYNLAIKIPIIAANIGLAYLVAAVVKKLRGQESAVRKAWIIMLLNPFLLYVTAAWGQIDSIVALMSLAALVLLDSGKVKISAVLLALAISFKPTALPLLPVAFFYLKRISIRLTFNYYVTLLISGLLFCVAPFYIFNWDPAIILQNWNAHFTVGGGISFLAFLELIQESYKLPGSWWLVGLLWIPALGITTFALRSGVYGLNDLLKKSSALILVFFLTRAWLSEPNIILILPLVLILVSVGEIKPLSLTAIWVLPLVFSIFNTSAAQMFFPSMPGLMNQFLYVADDLHRVRIIVKILLVIPWQIAGWWIVKQCFKKTPVLQPKITP